MKFGQSLAVSSVPEWWTHNIMYKELKHEIKDLTATPAGFSKSGYQTLVESFRDEYANVNLFVSCKTSEIEYRFQQCHQMIRQLAASGPQDEALLELKKEIARLTQDIQNLSRFITAQFTGFRKLIKKYRRHAPTQQLEQHRDLEEISELLASKDSFAKVDLTPQFLELSVLYKTLRTQNFDEYVKKPERATSIVDQMAEFDVELVTAPSLTVYRFWIHPDNLMQVKVLLLRHMDLLSPNGLQKDSRLVDELTRSIYLDTKELQSARNLKEPAQIRQIRLGSAQPNAFLLAPMGGTRHPAKMPISAEQWQLVVDGHNDEFWRSVEADAHASVGAQLAGAWALSHKVRPVVDLEMHCLRFKSGTAADKISARISVNARVDGHVFPYAVLEIRTRTQASWVDALKDNSLLYAVSPSFSLYAWALLTTRPHQVLVRPSWLDTLEDDVDIRALPSESGTNGRLDVSGDANGDANGDASSRFRPSSRKSIGNLRLAREPGSSADTQATSPESPPRRRYWNEFDDGDEFQDDSNVHFFDEIDAELQRARTAAKLAQPVYKIGEGMRRHLYTWLDRRPSSDMDSSASVRSIDSQSSNESRMRSYSPRLSLRRQSQNYGACEDGLPEHREPSDPGLLFYTTLLFTSSIVIVGLVFYLLLTEDMAHISTFVRAFLVGALSVSLCLALAGYVIYNLRSRSGWKSQMLVHVALLTVVCFGVGGAANIAIPV